MQRYSDIVKFSRDLYFHVLDNFVFNSTLQAPKPTKFMENAKLTLETFCEAFGSKFFEVFEKSFSKSLDTEVKFMKYVIPRCLKLIDGENYYFSFMLVAAFIVELVCTLKCQRHCYRFTSTAYKCLVAVFKREFEGTFEEEGGWKGLGTFCCRTNRCISTRTSINSCDVLTNGNYFLRNSVFDLIKGCDSLEEEFTLNGYEGSQITVDENLSLKEAFNNLHIAEKDFPEKVKWSYLNEDKHLRWYSSSASSGSERAVMPLSTNVASVDEDLATMDITEKYAVVYCPRKPDGTTEYDADESEIESDWGIDETATGRLVQIPLSQRTKFTKTVTGHLCKWCKKRCFQYSRYILRNLQDLSLEPIGVRKPRNSKSKVLRGRELSWIPKRFVKHRDLSSKLKRFRK